MGLFINGHSNIYQSKQPINEPNQEQVVVDRFSEWAKQQKRINRRLSRSYNMLNHLYERHDNTQKDILRTLDENEKRHDHHDSFKQQVLNRLSKSDRRQMEMEDWMKQEELAKSELMDELKSLHDSNQAIIKELTKQDHSSEELAGQLHDMLEVQQKIAEQITSHDHQQKQIVAQLENQEALIEKIGRQMTNFRSILYERSNHLAEKIDDQYQLTSAYVHKLLTGKENPLTFVVSKKDEE
ncbi:hypothetical protein TMU01_06370 [Tenuibacillus multivorans]|uniref:hypothetical protein n=1 Tax=Tenuibacillus multivorans TaxID=237069 RepID=UPI000B804222|nr:hypothetical protein [Tenuibacillus multivorans]GEL76402.1 hypothetical protein TMU01_06370 [Tenuibacillus multivorans]